MNYRNLGSTGLKVSEIGFGTWQLGNDRDWDGMTSDEAKRLIHRAMDLGCNFFDTAPNYGGGRSETLLGESYKGKRQSVIISTKFGHWPDGSTDYNPERITESVEKSLQRLNTDYIDILLLHNPPFQYLNNSMGHFDTLEKLVKAGKLRFYGASVDYSREIQEVLDHTGSTVLEVLFNIFHQEPATAFQGVRAGGAGIIAKVPLDSGWLTGKYHRDSRFNDIRSRWTEEVIERRAMLMEGIREILKSETAGMIHAALQFILSYGEVSTVIPGMKKMQQLEENLSAGANSLPREIVNRLKKFWEEELKDNPVPW